MHRQFSKDVYMVSEYMKKCITLVIKKNSSQNFCVSIQTEQLTNENRAKAG